MTADAPTITPTDRELLAQSPLVLVSAKDAAAPCSISERLWRGCGSNGRCPAGTLNCTRHRVELYESAGHRPLTLSRTRVFEVSHTKVPTTYPVQPRNSPT